MTVTLTNIELHVYGTVLYDSELKWNDLTEDFESGKTPYKTPMISISFKAETNEPLIVGGIYSDGTNNFKAVTPYKIRNLGNHVSEFSIPKELTLISNPYGS